MKQRYLVIIALCVGFSLLFALAGPLAAQQKTAKQKYITYDGRVTLLSKTASTVGLQVKQGVIQIAYTTDTKFTYRNKPGSIDDVKEGRRVIVVIDPAQKAKMVAVRIDVREGK